MLNPTVHLPGPRLLNGGKSLHPFQRTGQTPHVGMPVVPAGGPGGQGSAPRAAGPWLGMPPLFGTNILSALGLKNAQL